VQVALDALRHIVRELRLTSRAAEMQVGLSGAQLFVLQALADTHVMSLNELADRTFTHPSSVSVVVTRLVRRGLVRRRHSNEDARRLELSATPAGRALLARAPTSPQERLIAALRRLGNTDRRMLARTLARLVLALGGPKRPALMLFEEPPRRTR
jgi:DNA-binding MarR family transcriptional regulator